MKIMICMMLGCLVALSLRAIAYAIGYWIGVRSGER